MNLARAALPELERGLAVYGKIAERTALANQNQAIAQAALARALWETGVRSGRVGELARSARATFEALHDQARLDKTAEWMKSHGIASTGP